MKKTAIIVPCYNEAKRLPAAEFSAALKEEEGLCFIFVNDGSTDATTELLEKIREGNPGRIIIKELKNNSGKAEAVRQGFLEAFAEDYENIGYWDADLATPLDAIACFCAILDSSDRTVVLGSRVKLLGRHIDRHASRHYIGRFFATLTSLTLHLPVYDTQCGAKVFKRNRSLETAFGRPFTVNWVFDVELLARLSIIERAIGNDRCERSWVEYPLQRWVDVKGSKVGYLDFFRGGLDLLKIFAFTHIPVVRHRYEKRLLAGRGS